MERDKSNGYEGIASIFIKGRGQAFNGIGTSSVRAWVRTLAIRSIVLDLGCGTGIPNSRILTDEGMLVYGIDASPTMVNAFQRNFPDRPVLCEAAEESSYFNRNFDAIIAWGLLFLLTREAQETVIQKAATALLVGGKLLFTSPRKEISWKDAMTDQDSRSLGAKRYEELIKASGLSLVDEFEDEGEDHYFNSIKI